MQRQSSRLGYDLAMLWHKNQKNTPEGLRNCELGGGHSNCVACRCIHRSMMDETIEKQLEFVCASARVRTECELHVLPYELYLTCCLMSFT